jgi:hypothetical protein
VTTTSPDGSTRTAHVIATDGHPFYLPTERRWVPATDLDVGNVLAPLQARTHSRVTSVVRYDAPARVHNLTIGALHNYVMVGDAPVLVLNSSCPGAALDSAGEVGAGRAGQDPHPWRGRPSD